MIAMIFVDINNVIRSQIVVNLDPMNRIDKYHYDMQTEIYVSNTNKCHWISLGYLSRIWCFFKEMFGIISVW